MNWISIKDKKPIENKYYLVCSTCGWIGIQQYQNGLWSPTEFPDVICDDIIYDVSNEDILYYIAISDIPMPNQPERSKREDCDRCKKLQEPLNSCCYEEISQMRCSEHCGNTVRGK